LSHAINPNDRMVIEVRPPKVTVWIDPGFTLAKSIGVAAVTEPIRRGVGPYSFVRRIQIREPPTDTLARSLTVCPSIFNSGSAGSPPLHWPSRWQFKAVCCAITHCGTSRKKQARTICSSSHALEFTGVN
jgi:hypothetical protein